MFRDDLIGGLGLTDNSVPDKKNYYIEKELKKKTSFFEKLQLLYTINIRQGRFEAESVARI